MRIDVEMLNLLPPDQPAVQGLKLYQQHFANARELIITLRAPEAEKAERLAGALAARLREETNLVAGVSWQPPWMEQPAQVAELVAWLWLSQPPETVWRPKQPTGGRPSGIRSGRDEGDPHHVAVAHGPRPPGV